MHNKLPKWINFKIIIAVVAIELIFVIFETWAVIHSYHTNSEWWPWFFAMIVNYPISIGIFKFVGLIYDIFHIQAYDAQITLMAVSFLVIGTLWWSAVIHTIIWFYKHISRFVGDR